MFADSSARRRRRSAALTPNLMAVSLQYLRYGFDSASAPPGAVGPGAADLDPTVQTVRFGLNFKL